MTNKKILYSMAAWNDSTIVNTMQSVLRTAAYPENIVFAVCLNYDNEEPDFSSITNEIRIIRDKEDFGDNKAPGIIRVRNAIRRLIKDETYFCQTDAHTENLDGWDAILIHDIDEMSKDRKVIISKQVERIDTIHMEPFDDNNNWYSKWFLYGHRYENFNIRAEPTLDGQKDFIGKYKINDNYFLNRYVSCNFIFAKAEWISDMEFPDYHAMPFEEQELSIACYVNGYDVVSPIGKRCYNFSGGDPKYDWPYDERWWKFIGTNRDDRSHWARIWIEDTTEMRNEVAKLMLFGKNKYMSFEGLERTVHDFYKAIDKEKEYLEVINGS
jgi:hypothetical protein